MSVWVSEIAQELRPETLLIGEHPLTITLGRSLKAPSQVLPHAAAHAQIVQLERGGGATLHNPGQVVGYPLLRLKKRQLSPVSYLRMIERLLIDTLETEGVSAGLQAGQTGVFVDSYKIASIGVAVKQDVSYHGFALNVCNHLNDFNFINPCGMDASLMTHLKKYNPTCDFIDVRNKIINKIQTCF